MNKVLVLRYTIIIFIALLTFSMGGLYFVLQHQCVDLSALERYNPGKPSILLDDQGKEWARFELDRRQPVLLERMPKHLINAFIAAEDWNFFSHSGISIKGIIRSTLVNLYHGKKKQGASTITQQLVKLLFFHTKKTFKRKIKEQLFAFFVERQFTKEQILQTYLNHLYFGCGIYGVEAAAQRFWGKAIGDITLDEAATLAAVIRSPGRYCPLLCPLSSQHRRNVILFSMKKLKFISDDGYAAAREKPVVTLPYEKNLFAPHQKESIRIFLEKQLGKYTLYSGGLKIQTTLNQTIQRNAERAFTEQFIKLRERFGDKIEGALLSIDVKTGEIRALIGGTDFTSSQFNRALLARRQMGSIFKPIVYATALEQGASFADTDIDEPFELEQEDGTFWRPLNNTCEFEGQMTLARALSLSNNIITIKTLLNAGIDNVINLARKFHLPGPFFRYPSLALGCTDVKLHQVVGAFNVFANNGVYVEPHMIKWVKDKWGTKIWKSNPVKDRAISACISSQVVKVLSIGLTRYKKRMGLPFDTQAIGKTGTTNDCRTGWFAGSTPELTTVIYIGRDDNESLGKNVYPITTAFPIWFDLYRSLKFDKKKFSYDPSLHEIPINWRTGLPSSDTKNRNVFSLFV